MAKCPSGALTKQLCYVFGQTDGLTSSLTGNLSGFLIFDNQEKDNQD